MSKVVWAAIVKVWKGIVLWLSTAVLDLPEIFRDKGADGQVSLGRVLVVILAVAFLLRPHFVSLIALVAGLAYVAVTRVKTE